MFRNDYSETCAPEVLRALTEHGLAQSVGYGLDEHSAEASSMILRRFGVDETAAKVHFLAGGTQTNAVILSFLLRPYEAAIACDTGHINVHETGAVEGTGHKVLTCKNKDGKLAAADVERIMALHTDEHMVKPRVVYISDTTETGTTYTAAELLALRAVCDKYGLLLFMDGARMGAALTCGGDVDAALIGKVCDAFYVGGTKNGALFGEAAVLKNTVDPDNTFRYHIKNRCAMLAKGFVLGIQFKALFANDLYFALAAHSNATAKRIRDGLTALGIELVGNSRTNQIFLRVKKPLAEMLMDRYGVELWTDRGDEQTVRIVTSFATKEADCDELLAFVGEKK